MSKDGPFQAYHDLVTNPKIQELNLRINQEVAMLKRLKALRVQPVNNPPDWKYCFHIEFKLGGYNRKVFLNMAASKLVHDCKVPWELAKSDRQFWVRTG